MHNGIMLLTSVLLAFGAAMPVFASDPTQVPDEEKNVFASAAANRVVGAWRVNVALGPCGSATTTISFTAFNTFHAGGTLSDANARPGTERSPGHGAWRHVGRGVYDTRFQFFRFQPSGALDGVQDVVQELVLDARARSYESTVRARVLNVDGSLRAELCGTAVGTRITID